MRLAHKMKSDKLSFGTAISKAWRVIRCKQAMKQKEVNFSFYQVAKKTTGLVMTNRRGTTNLDLIPVQFHPKKKVAGATPRKKNITQVKFFDLDKNGWRSFKADRYLAAVL